VPRQFMESIYERYDPVRSMERKMGTTLMSKSLPTDLKSRIYGTQMEERRQFRDRALNIPPFEIRREKEEEVETPKKRVKFSPAMDEEETPKRQVQFRQEPPPFNLEESFHYETPTDTDRLDDSILEEEEEIPTPTQRRTRVFTNSGRSPARKSTRPSKPPDRYQGGSGFKWINV